MIRNRATFRLCMYVCTESQGDHVIYDCGRSLRFSFNLPSTADRRKHLAHRRAANGALLLRRRFRQKWQTLLCNRNRRRHSRKGRVRNGCISNRTNETFVFPFCVHHFLQHWRNRYLQISEKREHSICEHSKTTSQRRQQQNLLHCIHIFHAIVYTYVHRNC